MNRPHLENIPIIDLQKFKEYDQTIPNSISELYKKFKGCKPIYNILIKKKIDICTLIPKWRDKDYIFSQTD